MVTQERVPVSRKTSYWLDVFGWFLVILAIYGFILGPAVGSSPTKNFAISEIGISGNLNSGGIDSTFADDDSYEQIGETKDGTVNNRLDWRWLFDVVPGSSFEIHLVAQATFTLQGWDQYEFQYKRSSDKGWSTLGTVNQTTMTSYVWSFPMDVSGPLEIKAVDTHRTNDLKRANQLWVDQLYILTNGEAPTLLGAPSNQGASTLSKTTLSIEWTDNSLDEQGFKIERRMDGEIFTEIAQTGADLTTYIDTGLIPFTTYYYRVKAFKANEESSYSNEINAMTHDLTGGDTGPITDKIIAGYFPSWGIYNARKYWVRYIPFDRITHVNYAFARVDANTHQVIMGDSFADETNTNDPETANGLPPGNLNQLAHYRDEGHNGPAYKHLKIIISVGGWSWSENFSDAARTPESRWDFAESLKNFVQTHNLDGADIDWEYPTGDPKNCGEKGNGCRLEDPVNHALLIMACRAKLDELGPHKELSIAVPAGFTIFSQMMPALVQNNYLTDHFGEALYYMRNPMEPTQEYPVIIDGPTAADMLDYIHIMNYDMVGVSWEETTRHHAPLYGYEGPSGDPADSGLEKGDPANYNGHFAVQAFQYIHNDYSSFKPDKPELHPLFGAGRIPASKLTFGVPMYGRGFKSVGTGSWDGHPGLFQFTDYREKRRAPKGTWDAGHRGHRGVFSYWDILMNYGGNADDPNNAIHRVSDPVGNKSYGPYVLQGDLFIGFDDQQSLAKKMQYLVDQEMAGVMFWNFPGDISQAQIDQGLTGATDSFPSKSLIHNIAGTLENLYAPSS